MTAAYTESTTADAFLEARPQAETMEQPMQLVECLAGTHAELEAYLEREGREYERRLAQAYLRLRAAQEKLIDVRGADGVRRSYRRPSARPLMLVFGAVEVPRTAYRRRRSTACTRWTRCSTCRTSCTRTACTH